jgi:hypothetical protein
MVGGRFLPWIKQPWRETEYSTPSICYVRNARNCTFSTPHFFLRRCQIEYKDSSLCLSYSPVKSTGHCGLCKLFVCILYCFWKGGRPVTRSVRTEDNTDAEGRRYTHITRGILALTVSVVDRCKTVHAASMIA